MPLCNCGRPCVNREIKPSTFWRHKRIEKSFKAIEGADFSWLRPLNPPATDSRTIPEPHPTETCINRKFASQGSTVLRQVTQELLNSSSSIRLIDADHLVLEKRRHRYILLPHHPNNTPFQIQEENVAIIIQKLRGVESADEHVADLKTRSLEWATSLQLYLSTLIETATLRYHSANEAKSRYRYTQDTERFHQRATRASPLVIACLTVISALFLFLNLGRVQTQLIARLLEGVVNTALDQVRSEHGVDCPRFNLQTYELKTALRALDLEPDIVCYVCCTRPSCCALYKPAEDGSYPENCTALVAGVECGVSLATSRTSFGGTKYRTPRRMFHTQNISTAVGRILSRPGVEECIDQYVGDNVSQHPQLRDIWHGPAIPSIPWTIPLDPSSHEIRLVFSLTIDWFNAHHSSQRGKSWSVGAIYLSIMNLPPHLRNRRENMILVGLIPGPNKPKGDAIQNFLEKLVDQLEILWEHGVYLSRTAKYRTGRLVRAALGPLVCDLDAVRPILGIGSHSHSRPCSICWISMEQVRQRDVSGMWKRRTRSEHFQLAKEYSSLDPSLRNQHWKKHGVRPSELLRLTYWDHHFWTVIDPMHNWFLGVLSHHLCEVFGLKPKAKGRRLPVGDYNPDTNPGDGAYAYCVLRHPQVTERQLSKLLLPTLRTLAGRVSVNPVQKTKKDLVSEILAWKHRQVSLPELSQEDLDLTINWISSPKLSAQWPRRIGKDDLQRLVRHVASHDDLPHISSNIPDLVEYLEGYLQSDKLDSAPAQPMGDRLRFARPPIDADDLQAIRADRDASIFPSWLPKGPAHFGSPAHGTLSANEARTIGLYHVPLTLIRLWGHEPNGSSQRQRLKNFLHLIEAVDLATRHSTFRDRWLAVGHHAKSYLSLLTNLFPSISGTPNEHLIMHQPELLSRFGPSRGWWSFVPEQFNGFIQKIPSNHMIGNEMELGQLRRLLTADDFRAAIDGNLWKCDLTHVKPTVLRCISGRYEGHMLGESLSGWCQGMRLDAWASPCRVSNPWLATLSRFSTQDKVWFKVQALHLEIAEFKPHPHGWKDHPDKKARNALILVDANFRARPAILRCIAATSSNPSNIDSVSLVVQFFRRLSDTDSAKDPYQFNSVRQNAANTYERFTTCYAELEEPEVVAASSLVCHVGYTPYDGLETAAAVFTTLDRD